MKLYSLNPQKPPEQLAAIDLGSNSFHMIITRVQDGSLQQVDKMREMVRLGAGLDEQQQLSPEAEQRALDCLARFSQRLLEMPAGSVRTVGTNTLRRVRDAGRFLRRAEAALGHPIEIISGREEARLVYLGVAHGLAGSERRLVVDIGGGSTELIVGEGFQPRNMESLEMGCVSISRLHFTDGAINTDNMRRAELTCALELRPVKLAYRRAGWQLAVGSSGTIRSIRKVISGLGWDEGRGDISRDNLQRLRDLMIEAGSLEKLQLPGLNPERLPVFPGGVAVLSAVFKGLNVERMQVSDLALREGIIYDMMGRMRQEDVRETSIRSLCRRFDVDMQHGRRVEATARLLLEQVAVTWDLEEATYAEMLGWAARIHELGLAVSHSQYHKHGAYLVQNADLAGFSRQEQAVLAALVRGHRQRFPEDGYATLPDDVQEPARRLTLLLRLAVLLHRSRTKATREQTRIRVRGNQVELTFPENWLQTHTLPSLELEQEAKRLKSAGFRLRYR